MLIVGMMGFLGTSKDSIKNGELVTGTYAKCYYESNGA